jgi:hypothetical protein
MVTLKRILIHVKLEKKELSPSFMVTRNPNCF